MTFGILLPAGTLDNARSANAADLEFGNVNRPGRVFECCSLQMITESPWDVAVIFIIEFVSKLFIVQVMTSSSR